MPIGVVGVSGVAMPIDADDGDAKLELSDGAVEPMDETEMWRGRAPWPEGRDIDAVIETEGEGECEWELVEVVTIEEDGECEGMLGLSATLPLPVLVLTVLCSQRVTAGSGWWMDPGVGSGGSDSEGNGELILSSSSRML